MNTFHKPRIQPDRGRRRHRVTVRVLAVLRILWESKSVMQISRIVDAVNALMFEEYHHRTIKRDLEMLEQIGLVRTVSYGRLQFNGWSQFEAGPEGLQKLIH